MSLQFNKIGPYYFPEEAVDTKEPLSKDDIYDILSPDNEGQDDKIDLSDGRDDKGKKSFKKDDEEKEDEELEDKKDKKSKEDKEDESEENEEDVDDELKDLEDELEDVDEEKLELTTAVPRREILKKYPKLFEEFPALEKAYYRDYQFTKMFATPGEAEEVVSKAGVLDAFEQDLMSGNTEKMLTAVKNGNKEAFNKIVDNYLDVLGKVDKEAQNHLVGNVAKNIIAYIVDAGRKSKNDDLIDLAEGLNKFLFNSDTYEPPKKLSSDKDGKGEEDKVSQREREFLQKRFDTAVTDVSSKVSNLLKFNINEYIDPHKTMTDFTKKHAAADALDTLNRLMDKDERFKSLVDKLWEKAVKEEFSSESLNKIKDAYKAKAKSLLPSVLKKARSEALKGMPRTKRQEDNDDTDTNSKDKDKNRERRSPQNNGRKQIPKDMSTLDYFMQD